MDPLVLLGCKCCVCVCVHVCSCVNVCVRERERAYDWGLFTLSSLNTLLIFIAYLLLKMILNPLTSVIKCMIDGHILYFLFID